jgi:hypothetical protein
MGLCIGDLTNRDPERLGNLEVDHRLNFRGPLNWQVGRLY